MVSCGAGKVKETFENESVQIGSTYDELVAAAGSPQNEIKTEKAILASYITVLTGGYFGVLLEKDADGVFRVSKYTEDKTEGAAYEIQIKNADKN